MIWGAGLYLADSEEEAIRRRRARARRTLQVVRAVRLRALCRRARAHLGHARRAGAASRRCATASRRRPGSAARRHVIDGIKSIADEYPGLEHFMIHWAEGMPPEEFKEQLRWFAKDVMPAFKRA